MSGRRTLPARAGLLLAAAFAVASAARGAAVRATVDRAEISIDEQIVLQVTVEGSQRATPRLPALDGFDVMSRGQSTQLSFVNGRASSSVTYSYLLLPQSAGTFRIDAVEAEIDGEIHRSEPFTVRVVPAGEKPAEAEDLFVTVRVSSTRPFVGQQIVYSWRLYRRVRVADARLEPFEFDGFLVEDLGEVREFEATVGGRTYLVSELRKALFPQRDGALTVPATKLTCQVASIDNVGRRSLFDDIFSGGRAETRVLRTQPIELEVQPLPAAPRGFSGLVGRFEVGAELSRDRVKVGESVTLSIEISGSGNVQLIPEPELPPLGPFKVYEDKPSADLDRTQSGLTGGKTFRRALVALEPGERELPPLSLTYFDPEEQAYREARSSPLTLTVAPAEGPEELRLTESLAPTTGKVAVRILADDILPIERSPNAVEPTPALLRPGAALAAGLALPPALYLGLVLVDARRRRRQSDGAGWRRRTARRAARRELKVLERSAAASTAEAARLASRCLRRYLGAKAGVEGTALTPAEAGELVARGGGGELAERVTRLLERLEAAQIGVGEESPASYPSEISVLVDDLERRLGR